MKDQPERPAAEQRSAPQAMDDILRDAIATHGGAYGGYVIGHFELVAELWDPDAGPEAPPVRCRWSPKGSSPHMSFGLLCAAVAKLKRQLAGVY